jgi:hypothetical protein
MSELEQLKQQLAERDRQMAEQNIDTSWRWRRRSGRLIIGFGTI